MDKLIHLWKKYITKELIAYGIVGALTTLVNWAVSYLVNDIIGCPFTVVTNSTAWIAAVTFAYIANNIWVFRLGYEGIKKELIKMGKFTVGRLATYVIEVGGMFLLVDVSAFPYWPVKIGISVLVILLNYIFSKLFVFIRKTKPEEEEK